MFLVNNSLSGRCFLLASQHTIVSLDISTFNDKKNNASYLTNTTKVLQVLQFVKSDPNFPVITQSAVTKEVTPSLVISCIKFPLAGLLETSLVHSNSFLKSILT